MDIFGSLNLNENTIQNFCLASELDFPVAPKPGRFLFKNKRLYLCMDIENNLPVWLPISQEIGLYVHTQTVPSTVWVVEHGLGIATVVLQVLSEDNLTIIPDYIEMSDQNMAQVIFSMPQRGKAVAVAGALSGVAKEPVAYSQSFEFQKIWVIAHGLGYFPDVSVYVNQRMVQPASIVHDSQNQTTVSFTEIQSGTVRCA